ncbi:MAG: hypothetical protein NDJ90_14340 [Oligoflexia bacterium]|nr:hypothetical protein [Oligoflexia bacterium]
MLTHYLRLSAEHPFFLAFVQFAILGTAGEVLAVMVRQRSRSYDFLRWRTALKALGWGLLGIYIKLMFLTASAGVDAIAHYGLPSNAFFLAFFRSTLMNVMLGPSMMILHRVADNAIDRLVGVQPAGWTGFGKSLGTLLWLWIPLHTFTFLQAPEVRIGLAAVLSLVLGIVMGYFNRPNPRPPSVASSQ